MDTTLRGIKRLQHADRQDDPCESRGAVAGRTAGLHLAKDRRPPLLHVAMMSNSSVVSIDAPVIIHDLRIMVIH